MQERLLRICEQCQEKARDAGLNLSVGAWKDWAMQVREGKVRSREFAHWLSVSADYWREKDQEYAEYLAKLAETRGL